MQHLFSFLVCDHLLSVVQQLQLSLLGLFPFDFSFLYFLQLDVKQGCPAFLHLFFLKLLILKLPHLLLEQLVPSLLGFVQLVVDVQLQIVGCHAHDVFDIFYALEVHLGSLFDIGELNISILSRMLNLVMESCPFCLLHPVVASLRVLLSCSDFLQLGLAVLDNLCAQHLSLLLTCQVLLE